MKILAQTSPKCVQKHGAACDAGFVLGSAEMANCSSIHEFDCYNAIICEADKDRLYLLNYGFVQQTVNQTGLLVDIHPSLVNGKDHERVSSFLFGAKNECLHAVFLPQMPSLSVVLVCADAAHGPWIIIDGNHRSIAHYIAHGSIQGIPAFVCVHPDIDEWRFISNRARS